MESYLALALILVFFIISLSMKKLKTWRGLPFIYGALMIFFLINALVNREQLYVSLFFVLLALGFIIKSVRKDRAAKTE